MSIKLMSLVFDRPEPRGAERMVLLVLADMANDQDVCWPGVRYIARKAALSERAVQYALRALHAAGFIEIQMGGRCAMTGVGRASVYKLSRKTVPSDGAAVAPSTVQIMEGEGEHVAPTRVQGVRERVQILTGNGADNAPQPSVSVSDPQYGTVRKPRVGGRVLYSQQSDLIADRMRALGPLFERRESTGWSAKEFAAFAAAGLVETADEGGDVEALVAYYSSPIAWLREYWCVHGSDKDFRRRDLLTLLNNWQGEVDRARRFLAWDTERRARDARARDGLVMIN